MKYLITAAFIVLLLSDLIANESESGIPFDSLKSYKLGEVEISGSRDEFKRINEAAAAEVPYYILQNSDMTSMANLQLYVPSGMVRTNSRGESMLFVRGAGERQLGLFFDGVQMNIPWDNRMDLSFIPTDIIGKIKVNKSANSIFYGPNVLGGVVNISTVERKTDGFGLTARAQGYDGGGRQYSLLHDGKTGGFNYVANVSFMENDGFIMSGNAPDTLLNQRGNSAVRTNTDENRLNLYGRAEYKFDKSTTMGLSVSHTEQEKGVAAETFAGEDARFWRYPDRNRTLLTFNAEEYEEDEFTLRLTLWYDLFEQQINSYDSFAYDEIDEIQNDEDKTFGSRLLYRQNLTDNQFLSLVFNGFMTQHLQTINEVDETEYTQNTISTGAEYEGYFDFVEVNAGATYDWNETPKTGYFNEAEQSKSTDWGGFFSAKYLLTDELALTGSIARRTRFPTMREQYSGALGKFKVNPGLKPETGVLSELGAIYTQDDFDIKAAGFYNNYDNLIEKIRLSQEEDPQMRQQRVNFGSASVKGLDITFNYRPDHKTAIRLYYTLLSTSAEQDGEDVPHLNNKPEMLGGFVASHKLDFGLKPQLEAELTGTQYESDPFDSEGFVEIDPTLIFNFRLAYEYVISDEYYAEAFLRLNNVLDTYRLSQLGIPEPGRMLYAGLLFRI